MNIAIFCSGNGSNLQAIIDAHKRGYIKADLAIAVSDVPDCFALTRAKKAGIGIFVAERKNYKSKIEFEAAILKKLKEKNIDLIALAGYMRVLSADFVREYKNRILNIHPSLLPSFKGAHGIKEAFEAGVKVTGPTVHFVTSEMDSGPIILQSPVMVRDDDTEEALAEAIHREEHKIYPQAIKLFVEGRLKIEGEKIKIL